ncbi:MAG: Zn-ribbon domain-containing OB-fold protein [Desulfobacteraceae bacterium]|nr:MAG: Zn-ribbon domain-containing OB-fold protein [Desulfobacteraceae bacterium]
MGFERFGIVSHVKEGKTEMFVDYLEQGLIMATKCKKCGALYFPPQADCPKCLGSDMDWVEVSGSGRLITYTTVQYGPAGFEERSPYAVALAEFAKGVKIFALLSREIPEGAIAVGMPVKVVPARLDKNIYYEFQRVDV